MVYKTPNELIDFLLTSPPKTTGQFEGEAGKKCCLGHYASLCGLNYLPGQGSFSWPGEIVAYDEDGRRARLPADHWLFSRFMVGDHKSSVQSRLVAFNDPYDTFKDVIEELRRLQFEGVIPNE